MTKNQNAHFVNMPGLNINRSRFDNSYDVFTSFDVGQLVPLGRAYEVMPGDTIKWRTSSLVRMPALLSPIMSSLFLDTYFFFVPFRLVWDHYKEFLGECDSTPWVNPTTYSIPQVTAPSGGWSVGTLADYFEIPVNVDNLSVSAIPFRCYSKIVKDWFYDENVMTPPNVLTNDTTLAGSNGTNYVIDLVKGGMPFIACKSHDLYTSVLPSPQRGSSVILPLGNNAPVYSGAFNSLTPNTQPLALYNVDSSMNKVLDVAIRSLGVGNNASTGAGNVYAKALGTDFSGSTYTAPYNLYADMSGATATTINDLRLAFQTQRLLERMARGGSRYYEILASQWGVSAPQGLIQRSEYLGGSRSDIKVNSVVQTSSTDSTSPQGNVAGYSVTTNTHTDFVKSFSEPGYIIALGCVRYHHSYSQGIPKSYLRKDRFDFYNHAFAYIGEQPIKNAQIYAQGTSADDQVFGYNEAWVDYRVANNACTGLMRPYVTGNLGSWHLGDNYSSLPTLSTAWLQEDKTIVNRVLSNSLTNQLFGNFYFKVDAVRPMPLYSIPGLIDHM